MELTCFVDKNCCASPELPRLLGVYWSCAGRNARTCLSHLPLLSASSAPKHFRLRFLDSFIRLPHFIEKTVFGPNVSFRLFIISIYINICLVTLTQRKPRQRAPAQRRSKKASGVTAVNRIDSITTNATPTTSNLYSQHVFEMTATDPVYASTSTLDPNPETLVQPHFSGLTNLPHFVGQQFQLQLPDQSAIQLPSSSQQQVLHIRASDGLQVPDNQVESEEASNETNDSSTKASSG